MSRAYATDKTLQSAVSASANGGSLAVVGLSTVAFQVTGTFVATVTFEGTIDASTWVSVLARNVATGAVATTATAAGVYVAACGGLSLVRARVTWTSGTSITVITLAQAVGMGDAAYAKLLANAGIIIGDVDEAPVAAASGDVHEPAANTAAVVTYAASSGLKHVITGIAWSYTGGIPSGSLKVEDVSGTTVFVMGITEEGAGIITFPKPKKAAAANTAMIVTLAAGGSGVTGKVSVLNYWTEA